MNPPRSHLPSAGPAPVQPGWLPDGVTWPAPTVPAAAPGWTAGTPSRFGRLPTPVLVLLILAAPVLLWLAVCLLTVGWPLMLVGVGRHRRQLPGRRGPQRLTRRPR